MNLVELTERMTRPATRLHQRSLALAQRHFMHTTYDSSHLLYTVLLRPRAESAAARITQDLGFNSRRVREIIDQAFTKAPRSVSNPLYTSAANEMLREAARLSNERVVNAYIADIHLVAGAVKSHSSVVNDILKSAGLTQSRVLVRLGLS